MDSKADRKVRQLQVKLQVVIVQTAKSIMMAVLLSELLGLEHHLQRNFLRTSYSELPVQVVDQREAFSQQVFADLAAQTSRVDHLVGRGLPILRPATDFQRVTFMAVTRKNEKLIIALKYC